MPKQKTIIKKDEIILYQNIEFLANEIASLKKKIYNLEQKIEHLETKNKLTLIQSELSMNSFNEIRKILIEHNITQ